MDRTRPTTRSVTTIPEPLDSDHVDVRDALATAGAMWSSGDRGEALRWLRRAAELATDLGDDNRALSLFKAQSLLGSLRPPPPADPVKTTTSAAPAIAPSAPAVSPAADAAPVEGAGLSSAPPAAVARVEAHGIPLSDVFLQRQLPLGVRLRIASDVLEQVHHEGGAMLVPRIAASRMRLDQVLIGGDGVARLAPGSGTSGVAQLLWEILAGETSPSEPPPPLGEVAADVPQPILAVVARALSPGADFTRVKHLLTAFDALAAPHAADAAAVAEATGADSEARAVEARQSQSRLSLDLSIDPVLQQLPAPEPQMRSRAPEPAAVDEEPTPPSSSRPRAEDSPAPPSSRPANSPAAPRVSAAPSGSSSPRPPTAFARPSGSAPAPPPPARSAGPPKPRPWQGVSARPGLTPQPPPPHGSRPPMPRPSGGPLPPPKPPSRPPPRPHQLAPPPSIDPSAIPVDPIAPPAAFGTTPLAQTTTPAPLPPTPTGGLFASTPTPGPLAPTPTPGPFVQTPTPAPPRPSARPPMDTLTGAFDEAARKRKVALIAIAVAAGILILLGLIAALS